MVFGPADAGAGASAVPLFASLPLAEPENESVPLPETSYCQVNVADAPPASSVPAGEAGADATVAAALPVVETTGEGSAFRRTAAPPPLLSASANDNRCSPAEVIAGVAEAVRESIAGACTTTVGEVTGVGAMVLPVFPSLPLAPAVNASVPEPEIEYVQTNERVAPPVRALPAGEAGEETRAAAALPETATEGKDSALRMTDAPPVFVAESVTETCWSPAETCVGLAAMESESAPEVCTVTGPAGAGAGATALALLPSRPVADAVKLTVPTPPTFQVQLKVFVTPPGTTVPAVRAGDLATFADALPVGVTAGRGSASSTTSASPMFCTESESEICCRPAETCAGVALADSDSRPGCWTVTGEEVTGAGLRAPCVFASTPAAEPVNESVPLPETLYCQVKLAEEPPASTVPAAEAGATETAAPAVAVEATVGAGSASSFTSAPPVLRASSVKETRFWFADALAGETEAETESPPGACTVTAWLAAEIGPIVVPALVSVPLDETEKPSVPLPDTFQTQVKVLVAPPPSTSPAGDGGDDESAAAAVPPVVTTGAGRASSRTPAPPVFCSVSTNDTCCKPPDPRAGDAAAVAESAAGACTCTAGAVAAGGRTTVPLLVSVPLAAEEKVIVPLPETSYVQVKVCDAPPVSTVPAAGGGELGTATAAVPVVSAAGAGSASSRSDAPPGFVQVSAT